MHKRDAHTLIASLSYSYSNECDGVRCAFRHTTELLLLLPLPLLADFPCSDIDISVLIVFA